MTSWEEDPVEDLVNSGYFNIVDPGPIHAPVQKFSIRRNEDLQYVLSTSAPGEAISKAIERPAGTLRVNTDRIELESIGGTKVSFVGVNTHRVVIGSDDRGIPETREETTVHRVEGRVPRNEPEAYSIDWLANLSGRHFIWPDTVRTKSKTTVIRTIGRGDDAIVMCGSNGREGSGSGAVRLIVSDHIMYLCATGEEYDKFRKGFILYVGAPDKEVRRRVRDCLSFALGVSLVYLGNTTFTRKWHVAGFESLSAYSMHGQAFRLAFLPPAPLHSNWPNGIDQLMLSRVINALYSHYEELKFGELSWAYWHAQCAAPHIAGVHYGAAIEALIRRYVSANLAHISTKVIQDKVQWQHLREDIGDVISHQSISNCQKSIMIRGVGSLNRWPLKSLMKNVLAQLGLTLSDVEWAAWKRRNDAAHGNDTDPDNYIELVRDNKLLAILFHRLLLHMTNASDTYQDYYSLGHAIRRIEDPVPGG